MSKNDFGNASLLGAYAITVTGQGGHSAFAAVGLWTFDGRGTVQGSMTENRAGPRYGDRVVEDVAFAGTYTVRANGMGAITSAETGEEDTFFAVREVGLSGGSLIARELAVVFRSLEPASGNLRTAIASRLPDGARFDNRSLRGTYVGFAAGREGQTPAAGCGVIAYDGAGGFTESSFANVRGGSFRDRQFVSGSDQGAYAINADGTGVVAGGGVVFVITRAGNLGDAFIAEEYSFFVRDLVPTTGNLFAGTARRLSD